MKRATRSSPAAVRGHSVSTAVRADKFEKPPGKTKVEKDSVGSMELEDEFADAGFSPIMLFFKQNTVILDRQEMHRNQRLCRGRRFMNYVREQAQFEPH